MIITLTPNTGIDYTVEIESFQLNETIRSSNSAWGMGGKATDASWILGKLGIPTRALGFAAGVTGGRMEQMLRERGVETDFTWVEGESRLNTVVVVPDRGQSTITSSSLSVSEHHLTEFAEQYEKALQGATCVILGGSLPKGVPLEFYAQVISQAHSRKIPVIFDSSGAALAAGLPGRPDLIKPNQTELSDLLGYTSSSILEVRQAAKKLKTDFGCDVIVTLGEEGAVAVFSSGSYFIHPLLVPVSSSAGAGDGVLAGMALAYLRHESAEYGLRHGFALAGAVLQTLATADFRLADYQDLLPQIQIERL